MFVRVGCGCIYLITEQGPTLAESYGRKIEYCGGEDYVLIPSKESVLMRDTEVRPENLNPDNVTTLTRHQADALLDQLASDVRDAGRYRDIRIALKPIFE